MGKVVDEYNAFILHYVEVAQQTHCEMFCLGCEMSSTEGFEQKWRNLILESRKRYDGLLTYNVNHGKAQDVRFWDALDVIGMSGYYPLGHYMQMAGIEGADRPDYQVTLSGSPDCLEADSGGTCSNQPSVGKTDFLY